jgi:predicted transcriptional regulator
MAKPPSDGTVLSIRVTADLDRRLTREARRRRLSRSAVARAALEAGLGQPGPDFASEARRQSLIASRRRSPAEDAFWLRVADATGWK